MQDEHIAQQIFSAKWVANGFPKSGTHLLAYLLRPLAPYEGPTEAGFFRQPWAGTYTSNSWALDRQPLERTTFRLARIGNGRMVKAHLGYDPNLAEFIRLSGIQHIFIYRDLRDVAVSQAFHILKAEDSSLAHPHPEVYDRENFDVLLTQVLAGQENFPGVVARWEGYAGWLDDGWVFPVKYEEVLEDPKRWAEKIFVQAMEKMGRRFGTRVGFDPDGVDILTTTMATVAKQTDKSPTYRRGEPGNWREYFKSEHIQIFEDTGGTDWLLRLGYEERNFG